MCVYIYIYIYIYMYTCSAEVLDRLVRPESKPTDLRTEITGIKDPNIAIRNTYMNIYIYIYICICVYIYIYVYTHVGVYM